MIHSEHYAGLQGKNENEGFKKKVEEKKKDLM